MKIIIFGASGSGTTTLAGEVARQTGFQHLDVDHYYWQLTDPPFQEKIPLAKRSAALKADCEKYENVVVSGSLVSWGEEWKSAFDLAVFVTLDQETRMERLQKREIERYGDKLQNDATFQHSSKAFMDWASQYDDPEFTGRSRRIHEEWISKLKCKIIRVDSQHDLPANAKIVVGSLASS